MGKNMITRAVDHLLDRLYDIYGELTSSYYIKKNSRSSGGEKIKTAFIVQMPELWDKQKNVYRLMCENAAFDPWLIIVPAFDLREQRLGRYGEEKEYFISQCINGQYILADDCENVPDIKKKGFDYLFYQRPYDHYLPVYLRSCETVRFVKNCYIPYATPDMKNTTIYPRTFFRYLYFGFMEDESGAEMNIRRFNRYFPNDLRHFVNIGYPGFQSCLQLKKECLYKRFLWAPRWSYDKTIGGSHFMEYYRQLTELDLNGGKLTVRPHPMMWENFIKTGIVDEAKVSEIISDWEKRGISVDQNKIIETTFDETDVLIADRSSVIPMYFLTGKPVIYCPFECEYSAVMSTVIPGLYIANNWDELEKYISMLSAHEDPLLNVRKKIIGESFLYHSSAAESIVNAIAADHKRTISKPSGGIS